MNETEAHPEPTTHADWGAGRPRLLVASAESRLVFDIRRDDDAPLGTLALALGPFRRLIKDYQLLVDSYLTAVQEGREARIQAIDMGRRGLHNEGADLLSRRLEGRVAIDFATAALSFGLAAALSAAKPASSSDSDAPSCWFHCLPDAFS